LSAFRIAIELASLEGLSLVGARVGVF